MGRDIASLQACLPEWRASGVAATIDLDWLEAAARDRAMAADASPAADMRLGATAHAAGFIAGWRGWLKAAAVENKAGDRQE
jgi:hypothetical protein